MHHISRMGRAANFVRVPLKARAPIMPAPGTAQHIDALEAAARTAVARQIKQHGDAGRPVHFMDDEGNICRRLANGEVEKLTSAELDAYLA